jgi:hypothetical protein
MAWRDWGNPPVVSTQVGVVSNPDTATLVAEVTGLQNRLYEVRWAIGASTGGVWRLELASSTGLGSTAIRDQVIVFTGSNQTSEFIFAYKAEVNDRFRIVPLSSMTASAYGKISAEALT